MDTNSVPTASVSTPPHGEPEHGKTAEVSVPPVNGCFLDRLVLIAADHGGTTVDAQGRAALAQTHGVVGDGFALSTVLAVAADLGLNAEHRRLSWADLPTLADRLPVLLVFRDGATAILDGLEAGPEDDDASGPTRVLLRDEGAGQGTLALGVDDLGLFWTGDVIVPAHR